AAPVDDCAAWFSACANQPVDRLVYLEKLIPPSFLLPCAPALDASPSPVLGRSNANRLLTSPRAFPSFVHSGTHASPGSPAKTDSTQEPGAPGQHTRTESKVGCIA